MNNNTKSKDSSYLKNLLNMRINEYKMLNATLCEMVGRNSSKQAIDSMKSELDGIMSEIENINKYLEGVKNGEKEVSYTYYDKNVEEKKNKGFYDSIVKQTKACEFVEAEEMKKNGKKYNYENIYKQVKKEYNDELVEKKNDCQLTKKFVEDLRNTVDSRLQANRFLVDLKDSLSIPEIMVKSIAFDPNENRVSVCIYDFVTDFNGQKYPILQVLKYAPNSFNFTVKHLEADGKVMYTEKYSRCHLMEIYRDPIDYASDDFSKIQLFISYQNVEYETSK